MEEPSSRLSVVALDIAHAMENLECQLSQRTTVVAFPRVSNLPGTSADVHGNVDVADEPAALASVGDVPTQCRSCARLVIHRSARFVVL